MTLTVEQLPPYEQISHAKIAEAAAAFDAAKATRLQAKRDLVELEQTREQALWADAEADENARAEGKAAKRTHTHTQEHDKRTEAAEHEHRVAHLAVDRKRADLEAAVAEWGDEWQQECEQYVAKLDQSYDSMIPALMKLTSERLRAVRVLRQIGGSHPPVDAIWLAQRQLGGVQFASGGPKEARVDLGDVFAELIELGHEKAPEPPREKAKPIQVRPIDIGVDREVEQRKEYEARMAAEREELPA
jgi:hypothetical protein